MKSLALIRTLFFVMMLAAVGAAQAGLIHSNSFENPIVTGTKVTTAPDGWSGQGDGAASSTSAGLANVDSGVFTTPFGSQAAHVWYDTAALVTEETAFKDALWTGITYTVTFNVAKDSSLAGGKYKVELLAFLPDQNRYSDDAGTFLAKGEGTATTNDMSETASFTYTAPVDSPHIGKLLALQIETGDKNTSGALVDNLVFSDDTVSDVVPPVILNLSPLDNETWVEVDQNLVITFNENVSSGSGNIEIRRTIDNSLVEQFAIGSPRVSISGATVTIDPTANFSEGVEYYVLFDAGTLKDAANNYFVGITATTTWSFTTTQPDGIKELFFESFESPVVSGLGPKPSYPTDRWVRGTLGSSTTSVQLYNEDTGDFSTPYGNQAFLITYNNYALIATASNTITDVYQEGVTYTLKFNVAVTNNSIARKFDVRLMYYAPGDNRTSYNGGGTTVASATGTASTSDMHETAGLVFTVPADAAYIGKPIDIKISPNGDISCLIDNLKLSNDIPPSGTLIIIR